ncbi:DinB family protein [Paenibacillus sp. YPG26]|uniref:DinB family protein n=1 Tax=Paenibacillus sp. YPG26 TaxID=2878915 RepID=UPI00203B01AE|nr:DinB family protein [Paenibacillus sp. YPG26]USB33164.1 DinB family protein [Paenibacillus sp. YPG26]
MNRISKAADSIYNYQQTAVKIRQSVEGLPGDLLTWKPDAKAWSIQEIVGHLIDSNIINSYRIRKIISEPVTQIVTFQHESWVSNQQFGDTDISEMLNAYEAITRYNGLLLSKLSEEEWEKYGLKQEEPITVAHIIDKFICNHVDKHLGQIERNKSEYAHCVQQ